MKRVYTSNNLIHCDLVRVALEEAGIPSLLRNELGCLTVGGSIAGPLAYAWPEVWVDDEDADRARACLNESELSFLE